MIEDFMKIYDNRHTYMQEWKEKNPDWKVGIKWCQRVQKRPYLLPNLRGVQAFDLRSAIAGSDLYL